MATTARPDTPFSMSWLASFLQPPCLAAASLTAVALRELGRPRCGSPRQAAARSEGYRRSGVRMPRSTRRPFSSRSSRPPGLSVLLSPRRASGDLAWLGQYRGPKVLGQDNADAALRAEARPQTPGGDQGYHRHRKDFSDSDQQEPIEAPGPRTLAATPARWVWPTAGAWPHRLSPKIPGNLCHNYMNTP
jgi:hypothetical protein